MRGKNGMVRVWRERRFAVLGKNDMLVFLGMLSSFQPSLGVSHEDLGLDFILEANYKAFSEKVSYIPSILKDNCSNAVIKYSMVHEYFNLVKWTKECVSLSKRS